jgi:signal transduction histidine kinase
MAKNNKVTKTAKQLALIDKEKEETRLELIEAAKQLALTAKEKDTIIKLIETAKQLAIIAKEKEETRLGLEKTAKQLAIIAKEKEETRLRLEKTAKQLAEANDEKLLKIEKMAAIGKLAGIMGHELRNPLGVIKNSIYFLNMKFKESIDEKVKEHMDIMNTEIDTCIKSISDVLDFSRTRVPSFKTADINSLIIGIISNANIPKKIKIQSDLGENLPKINIDIDQITQVILNIITNAIEAISEEGEIKITTTKIDSFISITFKDSGSGISKENMEKLFTPLFSTKDKGHGLGLVACQNIIEGHNGKIEFESKEGKGTTFIIKLPIVQN